MGIILAPAFRNILQEEKIEGTPIQPEDMVLSSGVAT